jgi:glutaredoxin
MVLGQLLAILPTRHQQVSTMKFVIRLFFRALRVLLGPVMLLWEFVTSPKGIARPPELQHEVDHACRQMTLYQFRTCPFCIKVRQEIRRLSLNIDYLDAQKNERNRDDLLRGGGHVKVPCLRITDPSGHRQWLYESGKIIEYLRGRFAG